MSTKALRESGYGHKFSLLMFDGHRLVEEISATYDARTGLVDFETPLKKSLSHPDLPKDEEAEIANGLSYGITYGINESNVTNGTIHLDLPNVRPDDAEEYLEPLARAYETPTNVTYTDDPFTPYTARCLNWVLACSFPEDKKCQSYVKDLTVDDEYIEEAFVLKDFLSTKKPLNRADIIPRMEMLSTLELAGERNKIPCIVSAAPLEVIDRDVITDFFESLEINPLAAYAASLASPDSDLAQAWFQLTQRLQTELHIEYKPEGDILDVEFWRSLMSMQRNNQPTAWTWSRYQSDEAGAIVIGENFQLEVVGPYSREYTLAQLEHKHRDHLLADIAGRLAVSPLENKAAYDAFKAKPLMGGGYRFELHITPEDGDTQSHSLVFQHDGASDGSNRPNGVLAFKDGERRDWPSPPSYFCDTHDYHSLGESLLTGLAENAITHGEFYILNNGQWSWDPPSKEELSSGIKIRDQLQYLVTVERIGVRDDHVERMLDRCSIPLKADCLEELENSADSRLKP